MGSRLSRTAGANSQSTQGSATQIECKDRLTQVLGSSRESLEPNRLLFTANIQQYVNKKVSCAGHRRLQIRGKVEKYPFWLSTEHLQRPHGGDNTPSCGTGGTIQYLSMSSDNGLVSCPPRIPNFLHYHLNNTIKIRLRNRKSSTAIHQRDMYPELDVISKAISKVLFKISISEDTSNPIELDVKVYEQHRTKKRQHPHLKLREMKVERVIFDQDNNTALIGKEFALILFQPGADEQAPVRVNDRLGGGVEGLYIRLLDTDPRVNTKFDFIHSGYTSCRQLPSYITHSEDYMMRVLKKTPGRVFTIKQSK